MDTTLRVGIVGYGSILNLDDIDDLFSNVEDRVVPIKVDGFKRIFDQKASWRETEDKQQAVLNVVPSEEDWFNGILIPTLSRREFVEFRARERGYRLVEIEPDQIEPYSPDRIERPLPTTNQPISTQELILVPTGKKVDSEIAPIDSYVTLCKQGARQWGDEFFTDFVRTTYHNSGKTLNENHPTE